MRLIFFLAFSFLICTSLVAQDSIEKQVVDFSLLNVDGRKVSLKDFPTAKGFIIVFTCNHCPFAKLYPKRLNELNNKYLTLDVPLIAISSTDTFKYPEDTYDEMRSVAKKKKFRFPYLYDRNQSIAKNFKADKTPHAFVIWKDNDGLWKVKYSGAVDDNGSEPNKVTESFVANAVDDLLHGLPVRKAQTSSIGCKIYFRQ